jgi:hypothetical protein
MYKKVMNASFNFILLFFLSVPAFAGSGSYTDTGYITWIKANVYDDCWGFMSYSKGSTNGQGFYLDDCNARMMSLLTTAMISGIKVKLIFIGNGADYKPLLAVTLTEG